MASESIYKPLDKARSEIRLLQISDNGHGSKPCCNLTTVSLLDKPRFAALSYVWGDASVKEDIILNGKSVLVTASLASALKGVRDRLYRPTILFPDRQPDSFRLWADTVCINQVDTEERNQQYN